MRSRGIVFCLVLCLSACMCMAVAKTSSEEKEIVDVLKGFNQAISARDVEATLSFFAPGPGTVMMGTGPGERWVGLDEIREALEIILTSFEKENSISTWREFEVEGNIAWGASMRAVTNYMKNRKVEFALNTSMVMAKQDGKWRIVLYHYSNITAPE